MASNARKNTTSIIKALTTALPRTLPVCVSFFFLAMSYGVLMGTRGFSFLWPMCMSAFIFTDQWMATQHKSHMAALTGNHNIPEAIAIIAIILIHLWKKNMLLSIAGGTATYMLLIQLVFYPPTQPTPHIPYREK